MQKECSIGNDSAPECSLIYIQENKIYVKKPLYDVTLYRGFCINSVESAFVGIDILRIRELRLNIQVTGL